MSRDVIFDIEARPVPEPLVGYNKVASIYELRQLGLPTLNGIVVTAWNNAVARQVSDYIAKQGWPQIMVRSDKRPETLDNPRGGYLFDIHSLPEVLAPLFAAGRIVILLEPANRYDNLYGINALFSSGSDEVVLEVVGPGFDVTDINRGDLSPHERIDIAIRNERVRARVLRRTQVTQAEYEDSVFHRLTKIGREVLSRQGIAKEWSTHSTDLKTVGWDFLQESGYSLLNRSQYKPLPDAYLVRLVGYLRDLPWRIAETGADTHYATSVSLLRPSEAPRFIFWDVVRPSRKYAVPT
jgi:hypothetical protein